MNLPFINNKKISWKITTVYTLLFVLVLSLLNGAIYIVLSNYIKDNINDSLNNTIQFVLPKLRGLDRLSFNYDEAEFLQDISKTRGNIYFRIVDNKGEVTAQSQILNGVELPVKSGVYQFSTEEKKFAVKSVTVTRFGFLNGYFQVVRDITFEARFLEVLLIVLFIAGGVGAVGAVIVGYFVTRKALEPIDAMSKTARQISVTDLGKRLEVNDTDDELNNLAHTFNSMLDRLENSFKREKQFVSDASHELRTPVSVIQGYINLLDRWGKNEEAVRDEAIAAIKNEAHNMNRLLESLLFLARGESERIEVNKEEFSLKMIINEVIKESKLLSEKKEIRSENNEDIYFYGDPKLIKQLLRIFIDNSIKFTNEDGQIIINSAKKENGFEIVIKDNGVGITKEDLPHIFERFYQADKSRNRFNSGSGLGLSIARWIIDLHQGRVKVESTLNQGTEIKVIF